MAINFPASPTDGQTYTENGVKWKYNSAYTAWLVVDTPILANTSSGQVLYNYNDTIVSSNGISFSTEANTLYVNGMNVSSTLIVDGNVGIGTSSPGQKLHIKGVSGGVRIEGDGGAWDLHADNSTLFRIFDPSNTARIAINNVGVGIGTSSPATKFHVSSSDSTFVLFSGNTRAVRFSTDTNGTTLEGVDNTGFTTYQPLTIGGSIVTFTINGSEKIRLTSAGNVGIGTSSPSAKLTIGDSGDQYINRSVNDGSLILSGGPGIAAGQTSGGFVARGGASTYNTAGIEIYTNGSERMRITSAGNVGIGTSSPDAFFNTVKSTAYDSTDAIWKHTYDVNWGIRLNQQHVGGSHIQWNWVDTAGNNLMSWKFGNVGINTTSPSYKLDVNGSLRSDYILFGSNQSAPTADAAIIRPADGTLALVTNSAERMRITSAGNVGIGTTSPSKRLHVYDGTAVVGNPTIRLEGLVGGYGAGIEAGAAVTGGSYLAMGKIVWDGENSWNTTTSTQDSYMTIHTTVDGTLTERMRITSAGNVGIGTNSPSYKLHVVGDTIVGVYGVSSTNIGVYGQSTSSYGVRGISSTSTGVYGSSTDGVGTYGFSTNNYGLYGQSDNSIGVYGRTNIVSSSGVYAYNSVSTKYCRLAYSTTYGVYTTGDIYTSGALSKGSGSFKISHPLPELSETHNLVHSFVEAPTADNIYRGKVQLENGQATVNIDADVGMTEGTFSALNGNIQVFLQNDSGWDLVRGTVSDNILTIISQNQSSTDTISWMVIGERQDQHMLDTQWTDEFGRPILEPVREPEPDIPLPEVSNENS